MILPMVIAMVAGWHCRVLRIRSSPLSTKKIACAKRTAVVGAAGSRRNGSAG
jgi:hypothetical protein